MRKNKIFAAAICLVMMVMLLSVPAFASETAAAQVCFSVKNAPGTVVIEALDGAPLPVQTVYENVTEGTFALLLREPDTYHYRVYQTPGKEMDVQYDPTVYEVAVAVLSGKDGSLSAVLAINREGDAHKLTADAIVFENRRTPLYTPETGDSSHLGLFWTAFAGSALCIAAAFACSRKMDSKK